MAEQGTRRRADARRNEEALLDAAAAAFVAAGVDAPVRDIAARAGVGVGTVYRHQVEACVEAGQTCLDTEPTAYAALARWIDLFVDFLVTKHGLATALRSDGERFDALHSWFLDRLTPVATRLIEAAVAAGEIRADVEAYALMRGVGNLCIGAENDPRYDARQLVGVFIAGLGRPG